MNCTILRYFGYIALSFIVGLLSYFADKTNDYLYRLSGNLITILITLTALYTTLTNLIVVQLAKMKNENEVNIVDCIASLKRNIYIMFGIIAVVFLLFVLLSLNITRNHILLMYISVYSRLIIDMMTFFSLFYFLYVIYDTTMAFYNLFKANYS